MWVGLYLYFGNFAGYSRIPIYDGELTNVIALLNVKQLIMVDYKDEMRLRDLVDVEYFKDNLFCVFENTRLDFMFRKFREGLPSDILLTPLIKILHTNSYSNTLTVR